MQQITRAKVLEAMAANPTAMAQARIHEDDAGLYGGQDHEAAWAWIHAGPDHDETDIVGAVEWSQLDAAGQRTWFRVRA